MRIMKANPPRLEQGFGVSGGLSALVTLACLGPGPIFMAHCFRSMNDGEHNMI